MIRAALIGLMFAGASPAMSQDVPALPDVTQIRIDPNLDMSWVPPLAVQQAIAAAEDTGWFDTFPATSTITQQVAKNYLLDGLNTLPRKAMEIRLAIDLANAYSAEEIMSIYAQRIYLGARCYGFEDAAQHRLGRPLDQLTLREVLTLAVLIKTPVNHESNYARFASRFDTAAIAGQEAGFWDLDAATALILDGPSQFIDGADCPYTQ